MKYTVCKYCGATLDHGERCECREDELWAEELVMLEGLRSTPAPTV